jgi:MoaA/NifB/PqqE/SkfB family radical SAM enzyme
MTDSLWETLNTDIGFPMRAMVSLTDSCPLSCGHCYLSDRGGADELTLPELETLFDELLALGVFQLTFTGGEPALRPDLDDIVSAAWERKFVITLKTSAALLERADVERLRERGLAALHVSLYHVVPEEHDRFVGREGSWRRAVDALDAFRALGGMCSANTVIMGWNADAVAAMVPFCRERGWSLGVDPKLNRAIDGSDRAAVLGAGASAVADAMRRGPEHRRRSPPRASGDPVCGVGDGLVYINPDGAVWLCPMLPLSIGNVREKSLRRIWDESELRQRILAHTWGDCAECMGCELNTFCDRCPGEAYLEHGDMTLPASADCRLAAAHAALWKAGNGEEQGS